MTIPAEVEAPTGTSEAFAARLARFIDRRPAVVLPVWIATYFAVLWPAAHRPLWFDELLTYYVSSAPNAEAYLGTRFLDPTPPLSYLLVRFSLAVFGDSPFAARMPAMLAFLAAGLIVFRLVARRLGGALGLAALGIFWSSSLTIYAVEARPYGLLLGLFTLALLSWLSAAQTNRWTWWHAGLALSIAGMFLTHCFSPPFAATIGIGELVRSWVAKRTDKRVWASILLPLGILPLYIPLVKDARALLCPPEFAATLIGVPKFYLAACAPLLPAMGLILLIWLANHGRGPLVSIKEFARPHETAFCIAAVLAPLIAMSYSGWSGSPFWIRYGIGSIVGLALILAALLAIALRRNVSLSVASAAMILILFCMTKGGTGHLSEPYENTSTAYRAVRPDLPFVTSSGLTFLEMDRREAPDFLHRVYYLTDAESARRYHSNIFEGFPTLQRLFPIRANVASFRDFTHAHRQFLLLATPGYPEDWLLPKLHSDGAEIHLIDSLKTGYRDHDLYQVTVQP
jgi:hypothetical protein